MANNYLSRITLPSGTTYYFKDEEARQAIAGGVTFLGVSTTGITEGGTEKPTIKGVEVTPTNGDLVIYNNAEFIYNGTYNDGGTWEAFGDLSTLGEMAYADTASGSYTPSGSVAITGTTNETAAVGTEEIDASHPKTYTPAGSVSLSNTSQTPTISGQAGTSSDNTFQCAGDVGAPTISLATAGAVSAFATSLATSAPGQTAPSNPVTYYSVADETLSLYQLGYNTDNAKTGDGSYSADNPSFTGGYVKLVSSALNIPSSASFSGTDVRLVTDDIPVPSTLGFTGTASTVTVEPDTE